MANSSIQMAGSALVDLASPVHRFNVNWTATGLVNDLSTKPVAPQFLQRKKSSTDVHSSHLFAMDDSCK